MPATRKVTISLPDHILAAIDNLTREHHSARSTIIAALLREKLEEAEAQRLKEGYLALAKENLALAEGALPAAVESLPDWT